MSRPKIKIRPLRSDEREEPIVEPCVICGTPTDMCCVDCGINSGGESIPHVCTSTACRDAHEVAANCRPCRRCFHGAEHHFARKFNTPPDAPIGQQGCDARGCECEVKL